MNISKALKVKNRLIGEVNRLQEILKRENSRRNDNPSEVNVEETANLLIETRQKLISLKGAIGEASAPLSEKLSFLTEQKAAINFYNSLPTREGEELTLVGANREKLAYQWTAFYNRENLDRLIKGIQLNINETQDQIDDFNARTQVNWAE